MPRKALETETMPGDEMHFHLLLAAYELVRGQRDTPFDFEDMAVRAWQRNKKMLGMKKYHDDHPAEHRMFSMMCGEKGLVKGKKWFWKAGKKRYMLSPDGIAVAQDMLRQQEVFRRRAQPAPAVAAA